MRSSSLALALALSLLLLLQCVSPRSPSACGLFPVASAQSCSGARVAVDFPFVFGVTSGSCPSATGNASVPVNSTCQMACGAGFTTAGAGGAGGLIACAGTQWTGQSLWCDPTSCTVPPLPFGCAAGTCVPGGALAGGDSCTWAAAGGMALHLGSLTVSCGHFGITQGPTMVASSCNAATLPQGTTYGRCDATYCYLRSLPNWTVRLNSLKVQCTAGAFAGSLPIMQAAEYGRTEVLCSPILQNHQLVSTALDAAERYLYFWDASSTPPHVWRLTLATGALQQVDLGGITTLLSVVSLLLDEPLQVLYVCEASLRNVFRVRLSDGIVSAALGSSGILNQPAQIALDGARAHLYVLDSSSKQLYRLSLQSASVSPAPFVPVLASSSSSLFSAPTGLVLSATGDAAYVSDKVLSQIFRVDLATNFTTRIDDAGSALLASPQTLAWHATGTSLLITQGVRLLSMPLATGMPTALPASSAQSLSGTIAGSIALNANGSHAYTVTSGGQVLRIQLTPGCSGATLTAYVPLTRNATLGSCPSASNSTVFPWGSSCALSCAVGYVLASGGSVVCSSSSFGWSGSAPVCHPVQCAVPALPSGVSAGTCTEQSLAYGASCVYSLQSGYALTWGALTISCEHAGITQGPTTVLSSCGQATLPVGTTYGRCDATYCYLQPLPGWTPTTDSLETLCSASSFSTFPPMTAAEYGRIDPLFTPLYFAPTQSGWMSPRGSAVDSTSTYAYVADSSNGHVWRLTLSTGAVAQVDSIGSVPGSLRGSFLDESSGSIFVAADDAGSQCNVYSIDLVTGLVSPPLVQSGMRYCGGMTMDATRQWMYVAGIYSRAVYRVQLIDGSLSFPGGAFAWQQPVDVALNADDSTLFVVDASLNHIYSVNLATQAVQQVDVVTTATFRMPRAIRLDPSGQQALWVVDASSGVARMPLSTGIYEPVPGSQSVLANGGLSIDAQGRFLYVAAANRMLKINVQQGCTGRGLDAYTAFQSNVGADIGSCPSASDSTVVPWGSSCALSCAVGYVLASGGSVVCSSTTFGWSGSAPVCHPVQCAVPALPSGVTAGTCTAQSLAYGASCVYSLQSGYALTWGALTISCEHAGITQGPTTVLSSCGQATLPVGTTYGRCDATYCYLNPLPGWTPKTDSLQVICSAGSFGAAGTIMEQAEYGRSEPLFSPLYRPLNKTGWTSPAASAIDAASMYSYVADSTNGHIWRLTLSTGAIRRMDTGGTVLRSPQGVCLDELGGVLYLTDASLRNVFRLSLSSGFVSPPLSPNVFNAPGGLVMDSTRTTLFVADTNGAIFRIRTDDGTAVRTGLTFFPWGICVHPSTGLLYVSSRIPLSAIYSVDPASMAVVRVDRAAAGTIAYPGHVQLDVTHSVLWVSETYTSRLFWMPLSTGVVTAVPFPQSVLGSSAPSFGAVLDTANRYAYWPTSGRMWRINLQDAGGVAVADQDGHAITMVRAPALAVNQTGGLSAVFFAVPDIALPFPSSLLLTRTVKATEGNVTAAFHGELFLLPLDVAVPVPLPPLSADAANWTIVVNGTFGGLFSVTLVNPCGFAASTVGGPGAVCAPAASACVPLGSSSFGCAPYVMSRSMRVVDPAANNTEAATCASGCLDLDLTTAGSGSGPGPQSQARALVLPPSVAGLFVRFDIASSSIRANFSFNSPAPFTAMEVTLVSDFAATPITPCADASVVAVNPTNVTVQCAVPSSLLGAAFRIRLRTQAGTPPQWTTHIGSDSLSSFAPAISPLSLARVSPFPQRVNASTYGDLIALGQGETLSVAVTPFVFPESLQLAHVYFGSTSAIQSAQSAAAANRSQVHYALPEAQGIPFAHLSMLDQSPGLFPCTIRPDLLGPSLLVCGMPSFGTSGTLLHAMVVLGGQVAVSSDSYSYPAVPLIQRVSSSQCVDVGNGTTDCPTRGGVILTVMGTLFSLSDSQVLVDGIVCPVTTMGLDGAAIECTLPPGAGTSIAVVVQAYGVFSAAFTLLSYARPQIDAISCTACAAGSSGVRLANCARPGNATLILHGRNFGPAGSQIFVGLHSCASDGVEHADPHSTASCWLPAGKTVDQPVLLLQQNGQLSSSTASLSYTRCPAGTHEADPSDPLSLGCLPCLPGSFSAAGSLSCTECPAGSVAPASGSVSCAPCPQRTRRLRTGGTVCDPCLTGEYQQSVGSAECSACPAGLYLNSASLNASVENCAACPSGASCGGGALTSANGFYITRSADGSIHSFQCPTGYCTACSSSAVPSLNSSSSLLASVATCCAENRDPSSPLCGSCLPGFVEWSGVCQPCDRPNVGLIFLIFLLSFVVVLWLLRSSSTAPTGVVAVFLYFTQSAVLQLGSTSALLSWIGFFQFDLSFFVPRSASASCLAPIDAYGQTVLALCVPLIFLGELCLIAIVHRIAFHLSKRPGGTREGSEGNGLAGSAAAPQSDGDPSSSSSSRSWRVRADLVGLYSRWSRSFDSWSYINCCMAIGLFTYTQVVSTCVKFLWCVHVDDRSVVFSTPSMDCRSDQYGRVFVFVMAVIVVYVVGFPLGILIAGAQRARKRQAQGRRLQDAEFASTAASAVSAPRQPSGSVLASQWHLSSLFGMYRARMWYWSSVVLVRRALFVVADVTLAERQQYRSMAFAMLNTASVHSLILIRPLQLAQLNPVEVASHVLLLLIALLQATDELPYSHGLQVCFFLLIVPPLVLYGLFVLRARRQAAASPSAASLAVSSPVKGLPTALDSCVDVSGADDFDSPLQRNPLAQLSSSPVAVSASSRSPIQPDHIELAEMPTHAHSVATHGTAAAAVEYDESVHPRASRAMRPRVVIGSAIV